MLSKAGLTTEDSTTFARSRVAKTAPLPSTVWQVTCMLGPALGEMGRKKPGHVEAVHAPVAKMLADWRRIQETTLRKGPNIMELAVWRVDHP